MKKLTFLLLISFIPSLSLIGQNEPARIQVLFSRSSAHNNNDTLHKVANEFASEVGDVLKREYPVKVEKVDVEIKSDGKKLTLYYKADIVGCSAEEADFYFEHAGSLSSGLNEKETWMKAFISSGNQAMSRTYAMEAFYGNSRIIRGGKMISVTLLRDYYWAVAEAFIASSVE